MADEKDYAVAKESLCGEIARAVVEGPLRIAKTEVDDLVVSTVDTSDCGPETAILSYQGTCPVERYETVAQAEEGHKKWVKRVSEPHFNGKVIKLGYMDVVDDEEIELF
jgi:hypothetical protein